MNKTHVIIIIVSVLIILSIAGFFLFKYFYVENEDWLNGSGDDSSEGMIFNDVSEDYWASEYISFLVEREIMFASGDGCFYPDENVTFEEFIEIVLRASMGKLDFENLSGEDLIRVLEDRRVFKEDEVTKEAFLKDVTKCEVATILAKVDMKIRNRKQKLNNLNYKDLKNIDEVSQTLIGHSIASKFFKVSEENNFYPNKNLSRAEIAEMIYLFLSN